jgi:DNA (cytosine-5)-methyltransferase 1
MPNEPLKVLDLFSGIGGFSLGLERAGMRTVAFCEIDPKCREILAKHWPNTPIHHDVTKLTATDIGPVDVICGGFPCQDISLAGKGVGIEGERSGLWRDYARIIGELRPRYVVVENVAALLGRGLDRVLGDLAAFGFDAEWHCIPASAVGAHHRRDRLWIVANSASERCREAGADSQRHQERIAVSDCQRLPKWEPIGRRLAEEIGRFQRMAIERCSCPLPNANGDDIRQQPISELGGDGSAITRPDGENRKMAHADSEPQEWPSIAWCERHPWAFEPEVGRVANGVPGRVDRLKQLGNAVVPQIPEIIGRAIIQAEALIEQ